MFAVLLISVYNPTSPTALYPYLKRKINDLASYPKVTNSHARIDTNYSKKLKLKTSTFIVPKCSFYMAGCKN